MISRFIDIYIHNDEQKLAIKISIASFLIFITILISIIGTSYFYGLRELTRDIGNESNMIDMNPWMVDMTRNNISLWVRNNWRRLHTPREIVIFDKEKNIVKNEFLFLDSKTVDILFSFEKNTRNIEIDERSYLVTQKNIGTLTVFIFKDLTPLRSFHFTLIIIALLGSIIWLIIIYLLSRYLARITIEPIRQQSRELEAYSHNVAHELRTPLSIMRTNLELLRIKPESRFIISTDEEITSMERIIESLLFLAKPNDVNIQKEINITKKTEEIIEKYSNENTIRFIHEKKHVLKKSSEELYGRILCNLIENAIKYKSEWDIVIELSKNNIIISNSISNNLSEIEQKNLIKAFYQWDTSRNSTGYGLGLALVAKIVDISGWTMGIITKNKEFVVEIVFK
jgi:two-component system sensor histidine kinase CiaH